MMLSNSLLENLLEGDETETMAAYSKWIGLVEGERGERRE